MDIFTFVTAVTAPLLISLPNTFRPFEVTIFKETTTRFVKSRNTYPHRIKSKLKKKTICKTIPMNSATANLNNKVCQITVALKI